MKLIWLGEHRACVYSVTGTGNKINKDETKPDVCATVVII